MNEISVELMQHASSLDLEQFESSEHQDRLERARRQASGRSSLLTQILVAGAGPADRDHASRSVSPPMRRGSSCCCSSRCCRRALAKRISTRAPTRSISRRRRSGASSTICAISARASSRPRENKIFGSERLPRGRFRQLAREIYLANRSLAIGRASWGGLFAAFGLAAYYAAYVVIAWRTVSGEFSIGDLTFVAGSLLRLRSLLEGLLLGFSQLAGQALYLGDLFSFFTIRPTIASPARPRPFPSPMREGFTFENVSFRYPGCGPLAHPQSELRLQGGEVLALVGENGAGKTTLVKLLARLYDPQEGRILLDGHDLREYDVAELHARIGIIFQDFVQISLHRRGEHRDRPRRCARGTGAHP